MRSLYILWVFILNLIAVSVAGAATGVAYHGRLLLPTGEPVRAVTQFRIQIRTPGNENCLMYEETTSRDLSQTDGVFSITIGDGTGSRTDAMNWSLDKIFSNRAKFTFTTNCTLTYEYTPSLADGRRLQVSFNDGTFAGWEDLPLQNIGFSPISIESLQVGGFKASHLLRVQDASGDPQSVAALTPAYFAELVALAAGTSTTYLKAANDLAIPGKITASQICIGADCKAAWPAPGGSGTVTGVTSANGYLTVTNGTTAPVLTLNVGTGANTVAAGDDSRFTNARTPSGSAGGDLSGTYPNPTVNHVDASAITSGTIDPARLPAMSGTSNPAGIDQQIQFNNAGAMAGDANLAFDYTNRALKLGSAPVYGNDERLTMESGTSSVTMKMYNSTSGSAFTDGFWMYYNGANMEFVNRETGAISFSTDGYGLNNLYIAANGNVGIGTNTPGEKFEVAGKVKATELCIGADCKSAWPSGGGAGTVTNVTSTNNYLTVASGTSTPALTLQVGTAANTVAAGDDSRFTDARAPTGSAGGDLGGTYPNPTLAKINGNPVATGTIAAPDAGKVYRWDGTNLTPAFLTFGDLRTSAGAQQLAAKCAANEKIQWNVITDTFVCEAVGSLNASVITAGTIDDARLPASATVWQKSGSDISYSGGNVGIGLSNPNTALDFLGALNIRQMAAPAVSSANEGRIYFDSTDKKFKVSQNGAAYADLVGGVSFPVLGSAGSAAAPTYSFSTDPDTGIYSNGADQLAFSTGGSQRLRIQGKSFYLGDLGSGTNNASSFSYDSRYYGGGGTVGAGRFLVAATHSLTSAGGITMPAMGVSHNLSGTYATSGEFGGVNSSMTITASGGVSATGYGVRGVVALATPASTPASAVTGLQTGLWGQVSGSGIAGLPTLQKANAVTAEVALNGDVNGGTTITDATGVDILASTKALDTLTKYTGLLVRAPTGTGTVGTKYAIITEPSSGNVGIGTKTPAYLLDVNGTIGASAIEVTTAGVGMLYGAKANFSSNQTGDVMMLVQNNSSDGYSAISFLTASGPSKGVVGYANASASFYPDSVALGSFDTSTPIVFGIAGIEAARFKSTNGYFGIGTNNPQNRLHVYTSGAGAVAGFQNDTGTCTITPNTSSLSCSSDIRLKKNIDNILGLDALNKVLNLQAKSYQWIKGDDGRHIGYIAQEVEKIVPELVTESANGYKQVSYSAFVPLLSEAIKEIHQENKRDIASINDDKEALKKEVAALKAENKRVQGVVDSLSSKNQILEERLQKIEDLLSKQK